jgi:hypothetical protein
MAAGDLAAIQPSAPCSRPILSLALATISGCHMIKLLSGILLLAIAYWMLRIARPQADGTSVSFLSRDILAEGYALIVTACVGIGITFTVAGVAGVLLP